MNDHHLPSRRVFLSYGKAAAVGAVIATAGGRLALASQFEDQLARVLSSSDALTVRQLFANLLGDPALRTLAQIFLEDNVDILTDLQKSLSQSVLILTNDNSSLNALRLFLSGGQLSDQQKSLLASLNQQLASEPAGQRFLFLGNKIHNRKNTNLLQSYVDTVRINDTQGLKIPATLGNATLDAVVQDYLNIRLSTAYINLMSALAPMMRSPKFVHFLKDQSAELLATFIPAEVVVGPVGPEIGSAPDDPNSQGLDVVKGIAEYVGAVAGGALLMSGVLDIAVPEVSIPLAVIAATSGIVVGSIDVIEALSPPPPGIPVEEVPPIPEGILG